MVATRSTGRSSDLVFAVPGLDRLVDVLTLAFEQGCREPDPRKFTRTLTASARINGSRPPSGPPGRIGWNVVRSARLHELTIAV